MNSVLKWDATEKKNRHFDKNNQNRVDAMYDKRTTEAKHSKKKKRKKEMEKGRKMRKTPNQ